MAAIGGQPTPGDVIGGRYRIEGWLGQGNMAIVFRATHLGTKQPCALKLVHPHLVTRAEVCELFVREAQVGARIGKNPYLVDVFDAGIDVLRDVPFLVMELLHGDTLEQYVQKRGAMSPGLLRTLFLQLGDALSQAHAVGVVHRDLKPGNLFLTYDRKNAPILKIADFGIAKIMEEGAHGTATQVGSPAYAAPEQIAHGMISVAEKLGITISREISPATDIWALGVIAFELLLGAPPGHLWAGSGRTSLADIVTGVALHPTPWLPERAGTKAHLLPAGFDDWLDRCLRKNAAERWSHVEEAVGSLVELLDTGFEDGKTQRTNRSALFGSGKRLLEQNVAIPPAASSAPSFEYVKTDVLPIGLPPTVEQAVAYSEQSTFGNTAPLHAAQMPPVVNNVSGGQPVEVPPPLTNSNLLDPGHGRGATAQPQTGAVAQLPVPMPPPPRASAPSLPTIGAQVENSISGDVAAPVSIPQPRVSEGSSARVILAPLPQSPSGNLSQNGAATTLSLSRTTLSKKSSPSSSLGLVLAAIALIGSMAIIGSRLLIKKGALRVDVMPVAGASKVDVAEVFIDGSKRCDMVPCAVGDLEPGPHTISVIPKGLFPLPSQVAVVERGEEVSLAISMGAAGSASTLSATENTSLPSPSEKRPLQVSDLPAADAVSSLGGPRVGGSLAQPHSTWKAAGTAPEQPPATAPSAMVATHETTNQQETTEPSADQATLNLNSKPSSKVVLQGQTIGSTPRFGVKVNPGTYTIQFIHDSLGTQIQTITVKPNERRNVVAIFPQ